MERIFPTHFLTEHRISPRRLLGSLGVIGLTALSVVACSGLPDNMYVSTWAAKVKDKLQDQNQLTPEEEFHPRMKVVAAGLRLEDKLDMQNERTSVNVRDYPGTEYENGDSTQIIAKISQGSEIYNVIVTVGTQPYFRVSGYWGVFRCDNAVGLTWEKGRNPKPGEVKICAIYRIYLDDVNK